jgi:hypothetical protein
VCAVLFAGQGGLVVAVGDLGGDVGEDAGAEFAEFGGLQLAGPAEQHGGGLGAGVGVDLRGQVVEGGGDGGGLA